MTELQTKTKLDEITKSIHYHEEQARQNASLAVQHKTTVGRELRKARTTIVEAAKTEGRGARAGIEQFKRWALAEHGYNAKYVKRLFSLVRLVDSGKRLPLGRALQGLLDAPNQPQEQKSPPVGLFSDEGRRRLEVHLSSKSSEWTSPAEVVERATTVLGGVDLDPCAEMAEVHNVPATTRYTVQDDGLQHRWTGRVYMNPPYGREIGEWVGKLVDSYVSGEVPEAVALVPARVDTDWFRLLRDCAVCFVDGRLHFSGHENAAPFPSAVVYLGADVAKFHAAFGDLGDVWVRWNG
jgi:hypothetical protein